MKKICLILMTIFFTAICYASFNEPQVILKNYSYFSTISPYQKVKIWEKTLKIYQTVTIDNYIKGVLNGEIGTWKERPIYIQAYIAQAITARTRLACSIYDSNDTSKLKIIDSSLVWVDNSEYFQVYKYETSALGYTNTINQALKYASDQILVYFQADGSILRPIDAIYGGKFGTTFTQDSEKVRRNNGTRALNYQPYLRTVENYETVSFGNGTLTYQKCGMSQIGALTYAELGYDYKTILNHYYGPSSPTVSRIVIRQDYDTIYHYRNNKDEETETTRIIEPIKNRPLTDLEKDAYIEIYFDEIVGKDKELEDKSKNAFTMQKESFDSIKVFLRKDDKEYRINKMRIDGNPIPDFFQMMISTFDVTDEKDRWKAIIPSSTLKALEEGEVTIKINAKHYHAGLSLDSSTQSIAYKKNFETTHSYYDPGTDMQHKFLIGNTFDIATAKRLPWSGLIYAHIF